MGEIFTIGYSGFAVDEFVRVLKNYGVNCVLDVRSEPHSEYYVDYNREFIKHRLKLERILYLNFPQEFGAKQNDPRYFSDGILDFNKFVVGQQFKHGVERVNNGLQQGYRIALMCAEKRPETCHRNIMVARFFHTQGYDIKNILADGNYADQKEIEAILVDKYFPDRDQLSLFGDVSWDDMVVQSYDKMNREIGYHLESSGVGGVV